jgi:hypothetical protein
MNNDMSQKNAASNPNAQCEAIAKSGQRCKRAPVKGFNFCRIHCFGRVQDTPWYYNAVFLMLIGLVGTVFFGWLFFAAGPTAEKQARILAILHEMQEVENANAPYLRTNFPYGHIIITLTERREFIPLNSPMDRYIKFDWLTGHKLELSPSQIKISIPDATFLDTNGAVIARWKNVGHSWTRGPNRFYEFGLQQTYSTTTNNLMVRILTVGEEKVIAAMGLANPLDLDAISNRQQKERLGGASKSR